ncbi:MULTISPECIES: hypothetical protein [unclassified Streptomyces]|uniref:hypothetical protein n=1 Tax=unclassified Streptomyces TaxID=2593676 RepID=UPI002E225FDA
MPGLVGSVCRGQAGGVGRGDAVRLDRPRFDPLQSGLGVGVTLVGVQDEVHLVAAVGGQGVLGRAVQLLLELACPVFDVRGGASNAMTVTA